MTMWPTDEDRKAIPAQIDENIKKADAGDGASARRVAELYEALDQSEHAEAWWRKAAALGDRDAISYVEYILN